MKQWMKKHPMAADYLSACGFLILTILSVLPYFIPALNQNRLLGPLPQTLWYTIIICLVGFLWMAWCAKNVWAEGEDADEEKKS